MANINSTVCTPRCCLRQAKEAFLVDGLRLVDDAGRARAGVCFFVPGSVLLRHVCFVKRLDFFCDVHKHMLMMMFVLWLNLIKCCNYVNTCWLITGCNHG